VEACSDTDVQIVTSKRGMGAKDQSNRLVAGSSRSVPQDSWRATEKDCGVKRMIRAFGEAISSTYSQTLNPASCGREVYFQVLPTPFFRLS